MLLSVIIVNYKVRYFCEQCLYAVMQACKSIDAEVIVADNDSNDGSVPYLAPKFPAVTFIELESNLGFAKANNRALKAASGKYVLFLNPDTIVTENSLRDCISFLEQHPSAGGAGVQMIDGSGNFLPESKRSFPTAMVAFYKLCGMAALFPRSGVFNEYALGNLDKDKIHPSPVLCGAFFMCSRSILLQLNGFDEDYFMYGEDIDLSYRIEKSGHRNFYLGNITIVHFKGESSRQGLLHHTKAFYNAMMIFVRKHYKGAAVILLRFLLLAAIVIKGGLSALMIPFSYFTRHRGKITEGQSKTIQLAGTPEDVSSAKAILTKLSMSASHTGVEAIRNMERPPCNEIIFCTGSLQYAATIAYVKQFGNAFSYKWHYHHSGAITGSGNKNKTGEVYHI